MKSLTQLVLAILWIIGVIVSKGFWWTVGSIFIPLIAWYHSVSFILTKMGWL